jgi:peptide/nickel transport system substrate-binding protein
MIYLKRTVALLFAGILLFSCGGENKENESKEDGVVSDSKSQGATFNLALSENIQGFDPIKVVDGFSFQVLGQIYEGLLKFNEKDLSLEPLIAESWEVSEDGLTYIFKLKKGVYFHDNPCFENGKGRELVASDVKYSLERTCSNVSGNYGYSFFKNSLVGAIAFHDNEDVNEIEGIKIIDDNTIEISLVKPSTNFLNTLAVINTAIVPKEAFENKSDCFIGTGPFKYESHNEKEFKTTLVKNENYHITDKEGKKLPYLDKVVVYYVSNSQEKLEMFQEGKLDVIVDLPSASIKTVVENQISDFEAKPPKYVLGRYPELVTSYLQLNTMVEPLNNIKVRQAIAMCINKTKIVDVVLNGEAYGPANNGIVPPAIKGYDYESIVGLEYNVEKAKQLLAEAGYKNGEGFPTLKLYNAGKESQALRVGLEIQKEFRTSLNINVEIVSVSFAEKIAAEAKGEAHMSIAAWLADFPTPDNFLSIAYGATVPSSIEESSYPNASRYTNKEFDKLYELAVSTMDEGQRNEICLKAEQLMINEAPIVPLWYNENYRLLQSNISGYQPSIMHIQNLIHVKKTPKSENTQDEESK